ncbi:MAG: hypothetical protein QOI11_544 [Candidatus Eremiobacteraeota bacterium]|jgi:hypothetical protein|nr:hypothetical protein [Candidatus Eremiobacteraeota bacterium]
MRARLLIGLASALAVVSLGSAPARADRICAFAIPVEMLDKVYSGNARAGAPFRFKVSTAAELDDGTAVPAGTIGYGIVRGASAAGRHNHDGMVALEPRYLVLPPKRKGAPVRVAAVTMNPQLPVAWSPSEPLLQKGASHIPLPVPGLAMTAINTVRWGRNITLGPGFTFTVLPVENLAQGPVC